MKLYKAYDSGKLLGVHNVKDWETTLSVPQQTIRDYARCGSAYAGRYTFKEEEKVTESEEVQVNTRITVEDIEKFKKSLKIGARFVYEDYRKDYVNRARIVSEKVAVVKTFPNIAQLARIKNPEKTVTMTYTELLMQRRSRKI